VTAARRALALGDVDLILPYVHLEGESEVRDAFELTLKSRALGGEAEEVADRWFCETVVRIHRAGEGASFTGLKPAGLDVGPIIPVAERALERGSGAELADLLCTTVREQVESRLAHAVSLSEHADEGAAQARTYVEAMLGLQVWAHHVHQQMVAVPHGDTTGHGHG
jgi:hypothetical protein